MGSERYSPFCSWQARQQGCFSHVEERSRLNMTQQLGDSLSMAGLFSVSSRVSLGHQCTQPNSIKGSVTVLGTDVAVAVQNFMHM